MSASTARTVGKIVRGVSTQDGAGVKLTRVIGNNDVYDFDPFLMLDAFDSIDPEDYVRGFPPHPHRGIETVTYLVEGEIEHGDSLGNKGVIRGGDCQWMTAGAGIIHSEMPKAAPRLRGLQFWLNLPKANKIVSPKYNGITSGGIPIVKRDGAVVRVISGDYAGTRGAFQGEYVKAVFLDVEVESAAGWSVETPEEMTVYLYILSGSGVFGRDKEAAAEKSAVLFTPGNEVRLEAGENGIRFALCMAMPLREHVAWGGPIVMNTEEELEQAFRELRNGTFIKPM